RRYCCRIFFFTMTKAFIPQMKEQNHGHIITVASVPGLFSTTSSKFAAVGFHESLAHKLLRNLMESRPLLCVLILSTRGMFDGCKIRNEVALFLAPLEPEYCVEQAMNAILIDQSLVCIPCLTYLVCTGHPGMILHTSSSGTVAVVTYRFMGSDKCMYPFIKNKYLNGITTI
uniref:Retinol dehydrogenase 20 n=1 Tax=Oncorhynchus mykiss TaxID=8022 RepID=A0A8C7USY9_ONCMY